MRNRVLLWMCFILSTVIAVWSYVDGSTVVAVLMTVAAVASVGALVTHYRRTHALV